MVWGVVKSSNPRDGMGRFTLVSNSLHLNISEKTVEWSIIIWGELLTANFAGFWWPCSQEFPKICRVIFWDPNFGLTPRRSGRMAENGHVTRLGRGAGAFFSWFHLPKSPRGLPSWHFHVTVRSCEDLWLAYLRTSYLAQHAFVTGE